MINKKNALVVGGSGMLKNVSKHFVVNDYNTFVVGRSKRKLNELKKECRDLSGNLYPLSINYNDREDFIHTIRKTKNEFGDFSTCICWIHGKSNPALFELAELLNEVPVAKHGKHTLRKVSYLHGSGAKTSCK